jgi:hypothetical protein
MVRKGISFWTGIILVVLLGIYLGYYFNLQFTGKSVREIDKIVELRFYEIEKNCSLSGGIFVNGEYIGEARNGSFILNETVYLDKFFEGVEISIVGRSSVCFGGEARLPFKGVWNVVNLDYYFDNEEPAVFKTTFNLRNPVYYEEMQGFVRPGEVEYYLKTNLAKYFGDDVKDNLDRIAGYSIMYRNDWLMFRQGEYWQTPGEVLRRGHGDCEDWAVTVLSLMRAYNSSVGCYNSLWDKHVSVMCFLDDVMIIYDQGDTRFTTPINFYGLSEQEKKARVRKVRNDYFDEFGLEPEERMLHALFNEKELIMFEDEEDFVDWVVEGRG